jgi:hypothetical protein
MVEVLEREIPGQYGAGWNKARITMPGLANGLYFLRLCSAGENHFSGKPTRLMVIR